MKLTFEDKIKIVRLYVDINPEPVMNIGHKYDGKNSYEDFSGKITGLLIGRRTYFLNDIVNKFYRLTKDYLIDNQLVDNDAKTVDFSQTNLFSINQEIHNLFEIYPLQNNVVSLNGKRPIKFNIRNVSALDKDRTFNFSSINKRYSYVANGEELVYDFGISSLGTIAMRAYTDVNENKQYLFEGKDESGNVFGLFRNSNKSLVIDVNGSKLTTNLLFETNKWQSVSLSFKENISSSSQSSKYLDIRVTVDDKTWSTSESVTFSYKKLDFMIGRSHKEVTIPMIFGSYKTTYPLYGQIEMIATRAAYCEVSTLSNLVNELKGLTKVSEFDEFGMLKKVDIHECGNSILSNTYEYKKRSNNSKYISKQIKTEKIKVGSETYTRSYESDALGNITKITDSTFGFHSYEYDSRGFLIKADDETYSYDKNGNIVKKGDYTLTYDSSIKDRLVSFNGTKIEYDSSNPLNPRKYGSNTYQFEGRRLVRWLYGGGYYDYVYNDEGLRIKKTDYRGITWNYIYDGNKLIREKSINNTLDFLYDEYDNLYGFIKDNSEKYLYIRDQLQNIIGITDINGKIVVKYSYDAWGALKNIEDTSSSGIGKLNPFRFKGYYYDNESSMYYCKTRYYVPQWGRWLSADSPSELKPENITELNLFCYCNNNPILGYDPNGLINWWKLGAIILGAVAIVAAVAVTVATCGAASVAGTIAITSAITIASKTTEVAILQYKKSKDDGDNGEEIFSDIVDSIFGNSGKIIGWTPITKGLGFASGFYSQSKIFADCLQLMKLDGFHLSTFLGSAAYSVFDRFKHFRDYMSMATSKIGYIIGYGFAFYNTGWAIGAAISDDYEWIADFRGYKLY